MSPRPYIRPMAPATWWLGQGRYRRYMAREVTCLAIGVYCAMLIVGLIRLVEGRAAFEAFVAAMHSPVGLAFHCVALVAALYHATTWFNVTPKAMAIRIGDAAVPAMVIVGGHYAIWAVVSVALLLLIGG